jgi:hypothetical protein
MFSVVSVGVLYLVKGQTIRVDSELEMAFLWCSSQQLDKRPVNLRKK